VWRATTGVEVQGCGRTGCPRPTLPTTPPREPLLAARPSQMRTLLPHQPRRNQVVLLV
jgi:hypothetical protein